MNRAWTRLDPCLRCGLVRICAGLLLPLLLGGDGRAQGSLPQSLQGVRFEQRLGEQVPLELRFRDETGRSVALGDYCRDRPVILVMAYYRCPMLCSQILNGLTRALLDVPLNAGKDFHVVVVSFDARETPELATAKKATYLERYGRAGAENGWHFLTGEQEAIDRLTAAVGFQAVYDSKNDQFAHASGIMVLTPEGKLARYFYDVSFPPRDLRLGLVEASQGSIGTAADHVMLFCFHYDPIEGRYGPAVMNFVRAGGVATMLAIAGLMFWLWRGERRRKQRT